jgi:hypothetical protein
MSEYRAYATGHLGQFVRVRTQLIHHVTAAAKRMVER